MKKVEDLTGRKFGKLTVVSRAPDRYTASGAKFVRWNCICDCQQGKSDPQIIEKDATQLRRGQGLSCGCDTAEKHLQHAIKKMVGKKFGRLTVLEYAGTKTFGKQQSPVRVWKCICDCQTNVPDSEKQYVYIPTNSLTTGNTKSCGCYFQEKKDEALHARFTENTYKKEINYYIGYTNKGEFYVDLDDYEKVKPYHWFTDASGYIVTHTENDILLMHRLILNVTDPNLQVDHILGDGTRNDNRKYNLRIVTHSQNQMNRRKQSNNTSGIIGVWFDKRRNNWVAEIIAKGKRYHLGSYKNIEDAASARKYAEDILHGDYSYRNSQFIGKDRLKKMQEDYLLTVLSNS